MPITIQSFHPDPFIEAPINYLTVTTNIEGRNTLALIDTGAQPCVIKRSYVPANTIINDNDTRIKGVNGPEI